MTRSPLLLSGAGPGAAEGASSPSRPANGAVWAAASGCGGMICDAAVAAIPRTPRGTVQRYLLTTPAPGRP